MPQHYAIFGGSFNPIHQGHVAVVKQLLALPVDRVVVIPTGRSPFKQNQVLLPNDLRFAMVQATFQGWNHVMVSDLEIKKNQVNYTYDTLKQLDIQHSNVAWHLVVGLDAYYGFAEWKQARAILDLASLWVVQRSDRHTESPVALPDKLRLTVLNEWFPTLIWDSKTLQFLHQAQEVVRYLPFTTPPISATELRHQRIGLEWIPERAREYFHFYLRQLSRS